MVAGRLGRRRDPAARPGPRPVRGAAPLVVAANHHQQIKDDVHRLLQHAADRSIVLERFSDAADHVGTKPTLRALITAGRELAPVVRAAREQHERYDALLESVGAFSMARLTWAVFAAVFEILVLPVALLTGFVFWLI
jgi:hypothetical protein